jgi:autotransporter-associated beta strand protein
MNETDPKIAELDQLLWRMAIIALTACSLNSAGAATALYWNGGAGGGEFDATVTAILTGAANASSGGAFTVGGPGNTTITGVISGASAALIKNDAGTLTLGNSGNSFGGPTIVNAVLSNYNLVGMGWSQGDFNYDGTVNGSDLNTVLSNYNQSPGLGAAVPEPGTALLTFAGLAGLLAYAWKKRK